MSDTLNTYIHPKDFIKTATPINDIVNGVEIVWLVDFSLQIASVIQLQMYERKDWMGCSAPTQKFFVEFLARQQAKIKKPMQTLRQFLNEEIKLVPIVENLTEGSFTVGFLVDELIHFVCPKVFTIESEVTELFHELVKNIPGQPEAAIQSRQIKLDPDYIEIQHNPNAMCQYEATLEFNRISIKLKVSSCGISEKEAIENLHRDFGQIIKAVTIQP